VVLLMDDSPAVRAAARRMLRAHGAVVLEAETVADGLATARRERPDALLLDLDLPDGDGLDVCKGVRADPDPVFANVPIVVLTGSDPLLHHVRALEAGADDFIEKPFAPRILAARLGNLLRRSRAERDAAALAEELERYVSSAVVRRIREHRAAERVEATILFSDLRGFTAASFASDLEPLFTAVSLVLRRQVERVQAHGGYVDKFSGDGLLAVFTGPEGPRRAFEAATDIVRWARDTDEVPLWHPPPLGLGIHVGPVLRGDLGSERRREHTVLGPTVNLAARLCGHAGALEVLASAQAVHAAAGAVGFGPERRVSLKGLPEPVAVHRLEVD
jgi:class 3 adenylate cyclase